MFKYAFFVFSDVAGCYCRNERFYNYTFNELHHTSYHLEIGMPSNENLRGESDQRSYKTKTINPNSPSTDKTIGEL